MKKILIISFMILLNSCHPDTYGKYPHANYVDYNIDPSQTEMNQVKEELEFEGDLIEFFDHVRTSKELMPFNKPEQVINHFEKIHERIKPHIKILIPQKIIYLN